MDGFAAGTQAAEWLRSVQSVSYFGRQLRRTLSDVAAPLGLNDTACLVLWACAEGPPEGQAQHELVALAGVSAAQLSGLVEQLNSAGWIAPRRPAHDRRRQFWKLTASGEALVSRLLDEVAAGLAPCARLSPAEQVALVARLTELSSAHSPAATSRRKEAA